MREEERERQRSCLLRAWKALSSWTRRALRRLREKAGEGLELPCEVERESKARWIKEEELKRSCGEIKLDATALRR